MSRCRPIIPAFVVLPLPTPNMAQTPTTPIDQLTLRVDAGNGYSVLTESLHRAGHAVRTRSAAGPVPASPTATPATSSGHTIPAGRSTRVVAW